ncbi:Glycosyl transferase 4-like domain-containing protein [Hymenobacter daecheongensis DSM 21074]|uniref:Glycosyl transferase 4-like domain-containing protein n=2 Tax=Hymenobacter daecheongensis TaxID=496053 RepID=A0A1M6C0F7_9BACT|nr:Glycosyl transferase 4-like domain-containing protein [Hymenobacter daecheongensis DSM 21074]
MKLLPLKVLLLGWDEPLKTAAPAHPSPLVLAQQLAPALALSVLLPHLPAAAITIPHTRITGLGNLDPHQLAAAERPAGAWQAPAAPYAGAAAPPTAVVAPAPAAAVASVAGAAKAAVPATGGRLDNKPLTTPEHLPAASAEGTEPGTAEASALSQPEDSLTLSGAAAFEAAPATAEAPLTAAPSPLIRALAALRTDGTDVGDDLNFRIIQYARLAAPQALAQEFAVIYAADWPVWLAALEIRQLTGRPLVLHVHSLAADRNTFADRGWALELERLTLRRADLILAASPAVAERLKTLYDFPAARYRVVAPHDTPALQAALNSFMPAQ